MGGSQHLQRWNLALHDDLGAARRISGTRQRLIQCRDRLPERDSVNIRRNTVEAGVRRGRMKAC
jgi:hypothetical protein